MFHDNLSEFRRGWKFWLTPPPSLRSKAYQVTREVLPYIRARLAFELDHAKFPIVMEVVSYILSIIWTIIVDFLFYVVTAEC